MGCRLLRALAPFSYQFLAFSASTGVDPSIGRSALEVSLESCAAPPASTAMLDISGPSIRTRNGLGEGAEDLGGDASTQLSDGSPARLGVSVIRRTLWLTISPPWNFRFPNTFFNVFRSEDAGSGGMELLASVLDGD